MRTLESIKRQNPPFPYEICVADDGSTDNTREVCERMGVHKYTLVREPTTDYRNPAIARNAAYRMADGEIVIAQSDDVVHHTPAIEQLAGRLQPGEFVIATVYNWHEGKIHRDPIPVLTGEACRRPFFFLGALWLRDIYRIGGNSEDFIAPAFEDDWFGDCLIRGLGLTHRFLPDVVGHHQHHGRPANLSKMCHPSRVLYKAKKAAAERGEIKWEAIGGPWKDDSPE